MFSYLSVLVHELGHAACAWAFGYPSIPSFDFFHGGGVTAIGDRRIGLLVLIVLVWAFLFHRYRSHGAGRIGLGVIAALYGVVGLTGLHRHLIACAGHGAELLLAGVFLYRAFNGSGLRVPAERPLYAFLGLFVLIRAAHFAFGLATSPLERDIYVELKGGMEMDFSVLAGAFDVGIGAVAVVYLACCVLTLPLAWLAFRSRDRWQEWVSSVLFSPFVEE